MLDIFKYVYFPVIYFMGMLLKIFCWVVYYVNVFYILKFSINKSYISLLHLSQVFLVFVYYYNWYLKFFFSSCMLIAYRKSCKSYLSFHSSLCIPTSSLNTCTDSFQINTVLLISNIYDFYSFEWHILLSSNSRR